VLHYTRLRCCLTPVENALASEAAVHRECVNHGHKGGFEATPCRPPSRCGAVAQLCLMQHASTLASACD
jgi:hypothetical protein